MATSKKTPAKKKVVTPRKKAVAKPIGALEAVVFSMDGKQTGTIALPPTLFGAPWNADLVHQFVVGMQANAREVTAHTKFRGEVRGGGIKPWKQKGTGRARHGSRRSPIWKGGGTTHGPRAERDYSVKLNKKQKSAALAALLTRKFKDGEVLFVDAFTFTTPSTKTAKISLLALAKATGNTILTTKAKNAALIVLAEKTQNIQKSFRNIGNIAMEEVRNVSPLDLVTKKFLVFERPAESFAILGKRITHTA